MAYTDMGGDSARLLKRAVTSVGDFSGRSRRAEVIYYLIATVLVGTVLSLSIKIIVSFEATRLFLLAFDLVFLMPMFALFVRRLHDQNRSGWWGALLPLSFLVGLPRMIYVLQDDLHPRLPRQTLAFSIIGNLIWLAVLILCVLPGSEGENDYGPDPRFGET